VMFKFKCKTCGYKQEDHQITVRYIPGRGVVNDIQCPDCGEYMKLTNPKKGAPKFRGGTK
jgi:C4-type Zn-finger protein